MFEKLDTGSIILLILMFVVVFLLVKEICRKIGYWMTEGMLDKIKKEKGEKEDGKRRS